MSEPAVATSFIFLRRVPEASFPLVTLIRFKAYRSMASMYSGEATFLQHEYLSRCRAVSTRSTVCK